MVDLFDEGTEVLNRSEDTDRSNMSDGTIRKYLYNKIRETSITIVIITPEAINYNKNHWTGNYDDWLYDELRYSLQEREGNRTSGVIALYTDDAKDLLIKQSSHQCENCNGSDLNTILEFDNLVRKNMLNVKNEFKSNSCEGIYDSNLDSYISLVDFNSFKENYPTYIDQAKEKRERIDEFYLIKEM